jgi:hypothetical protein
MKFENLTSSLNCILSDSGMDLAQSVPVVQHTFGNNVGGNATNPNDFCTCAFFNDPSCQNCQWLRQDTSQNKDFGPSICGFATLESYPYAPVAEIFQVGNEDDFLDQNYTSSQDFPSEPHLTLVPSSTSENFQWILTDTTNAAYESSMILEPGIAHLDCILPDHDMIDDLQLHEFDFLSSANTTLLASDFGLGLSSEQHNSESKSV